MEEPDYFPDLPGRRDSLEKSQPHSAEAEKTSLGSVFLDNNVFPQLIELLLPEDYYIRKHQLIYLAMLAVYERGDEISPITVAEELKKTNSLETAGGLLYITNTGSESIAYGLPHTTNIEHYAKVIKGKSLLRQIIRTGNKMIQESFAEEDEPKVILEHTTKAVFDIAIGETKPGFSKIGLLVHRNLQKTYEIQQHGTALTGLSTGFTDLDSITLGLQRKDFIILAARPSIGKTALALMFSQHAAVRGGATVAYFSLEMGEESLGYRILGSEAKVDSQRLRNGFLSQLEWDRLNDVDHATAQSKLYILDTPGISTLGIKVKARRLIAEVGKMDLIVVDYLQLMSGTAKKFESRQQEVSQISRELKGLALELDVPLVALSQLSRAPENRTDHRPVLADLRESGSLEQDADLVAMLYREDVYKSKTDHAATFTNTMEVIIAKQRNGPTGTIALKFDQSTGWFDNLYEEH